jgi:hypothetical protein
MASRAGHRFVPLNRLRLREASASVTRHEQAIVLFASTEAPSKETNDMSKKKQLKDLFIEDLGQVTGGGKKPPYTTLAIGEEGPEPTTLAIGEEGDTTMALGEENWETTMALGEEEPIPSY